METGRLDPELIQGILQSLYRLFRVGSLHALDNAAVAIATNSTLEALQNLNRFESDGITLIFAEDTCIVNGQLLRAPPDVYESAMNFSRFLERTSVNSITIDKNVVHSDLQELLRLFMAGENAASHINPSGYLSPNIRLRMVNPNLLLGLEDERLSQLERILLTYALSVLVLRRLFVSIGAGGFDVAGYFKRMARQLATVNYTDRPVVFDVIFARHLKPDPAKLAVNTAILAVAIARRFTQHDITLSRICTAAILVDIGKHRPNALHPRDEPGAVALSTAVLHMAMGSLHADSVDRTIVAYEAQALVAGLPPSQFYSDGTEPSADAHIICVARRFVLLVSWGVGHGPLSADDSIQWLHDHAPNALGHYCVDLLMDAIGLIPRGTCVELDNGFRGVVVRSGPTPSLYDRPVVRLVEDHRGERCEPADVDLTNPEQAGEIGPVVRVLHRPSAFVVAAQREIAGPLMTWIAQRQVYEAEVARWLAQEAAVRDQAGPARPATGKHASTGDARGEFSRSGSGIAHPTIGPSGSFERADSGVRLAAPVSVSASVDAVGFTRDATDARQRAISWRSETGSAAAADPSARVLPRSAASIEFDRRRAVAVPDDFARYDSGVHRSLTGSARVVAAKGGTSGAHIAPRSAETGGATTASPTAAAPRPPSSQAPAVVAPTQQPQRPQARVSGSGIHRTVRPRRATSNAPEAAAPPPSEAQPRQVSGASSTVPRHDAPGSGIFRHARSGNQAAASEQSFQDRPDTRPGRPKTSEE